MDLAPPSGELTLREAADHLGVHYMTVYRHVRLGTLAAHKEGGTWRVRADDLVSLAERPAPRRGGPSAPWDERFEARILSGDLTGAVGVLEAALESGADLTGLSVDVIAPALRSIGERWHAGELDVADEHLASAVTGRALSRIAARFAHRGRTRGSVVLGVVAGDHHSLPVALLADVIGAAGFDALDLGADVPAASFARAAVQAPDLVAVGISATTPDRDEAVMAVTAAVRAARPDICVLLGGGAVRGQEHALDLGADGWAPDARRALVCLEETLDRGQLTRSGRIRGPLT